MRISDWSSDVCSSDLRRGGLLRSRLTLIRLALIRKPYPFGGRVSHPPYRYLCLHLLFQSLQKPFRITFAAIGMLPYLLYPKIQNQRLGSALDASLLSMTGRSTRELLRTL